MTDKAEERAGVPDEDELAMKRAAREAEEQGKRPARAGAEEEKILEDEMIDEASEESFPASDPPSYTRGP